MITKRFFNNDADGQEFGKEVSLTPKEVEFFDGLEDQICDHSGIRKRNLGFAKVLIVDMEDDNFLSIETTIGIEGKFEEEWSDLTYDRKQGKIITLNL